MKPSTTDEGRRRVGTYSTEKGLSWEIDQCLMGAAVPCSGLEWQSWRCSEAGAGDSRVGKGVQDRRLELVSLCGVAVGLGEEKRSLRLALGGLMREWRGLVEMGVHVTIGGSEFWRGDVTSHCHGTQTYEGIYNFAILTQFWYFSKQVFVVSQFCNS